MFHLDHTKAEVCPLSLAFVVTGFDARNCVRNVGSALNDRSPQKRQVGPARLQQIA